MSVVLKSFVGGLILYLSWIDCMRLNCIALHCIGSDWMDDVVDR